MYERKSTNVVWQDPGISRAQRNEMNGHGSVLLWFTGLSGSGKSTLARAVEEYLHGSGCRTFVLDGDNVRHGLCSDLGFSAADRAENIRRIGETAKLCVEAGLITLGAFISPFRADRERVRRLMGPGGLIEIYCECPLEVCEQRDVKGLYKRARRGEIRNFTGISSPYEAPAAPELALHTAKLGVAECVERVVDILQLRGVVPGLKTRRIS